MEAIILAGGYGRRLQSVVQDIPKPMADINRKPFLEYLLDYLILQKVNKVVLAVGYKYQVIQEYFGCTYKGLQIEYSIETEPLGTGGAIKKALTLVNNNQDVPIFNGDTFFCIDLPELYKLHKQKKAVITLSLKMMKNFDRYGTVIINSANKITGFEEKNFKDYGLINGGVYIFNKAFFEQIYPKEKFSFERDILEKYYANEEFYGFEQDKYFIDIGIPEDYQRAQYEFNKEITYR